MRDTWVSTLVAVTIAAAGAYFLVRGPDSLAAAETSRLVPPPVVDSAPAPATPPATAAASAPATASPTSETAVLAGGCFWGVQGVFQRVKGVTNAVSGYAGGDERTAEYETVSTGTTGHAESVRITYDPRQVSYGRLLQVFFSVAHDPTQKNRQGPDSGTQYRSAIFPQTDEQARIAKAYIAQLDQAKVFTAPLATTIEARRRFFTAEAYHQDYLTTHPDQPYIVYNDLPKVADLKRLFPDAYLETPVLVRGRR